jgi:hypothetical protein
MPNIAHLNLRIETQPSNETPRQGFEFADLHQTQEGNDYCLAGTFQYTGDPLQQYVVIAAVLYNNQNQLLNFAEYTTEPADLVSGQPGEFKVCVDTLTQDIARYELRAWGQ